jgi:hypothetical protein
MTQKEIKEKMTTGEWVYTSKDMTSINYGSIDCWTLDSVGNTHNTVANAAAIVSAINNTYGKNINPESVSEMLNTLIIIEKRLRGLGLYETADSIQNVIKNATL